MGFKDVGAKVEEVKGKIDEALAKTDIDEKIMANSDEIIWHIFIVLKKIREKNVKMSKKAVKIT